jgi:hypothetical protein
MHLGKAARGPAAGPFRHGRYSKVLPKDLRAGYERGLRDPDLVESRDDIAILDEMVRDRWRGLEDGRGVVIGRELEEAAVQVGAGLRAAAARLRQNLVENDPTAAYRVVQALLDIAGDQGAVGRVLRLIKAGRSRQTVEAEVVDLMERAGRARDREVRLQVAKKQMLSLEEAQTYFRLVIDSVSRRVSDPRIVSAVIDDVERWTSGGSVPALPAAV